MRAGKDGQPQSQVFSYQYDALGRRIAKTDSFGTTVFTWEGMRLLQESRGQHTSTYIYEPGSYVPLARIDGSGSLEPHPAAANALGAGGDASEGKQASIPTTNPGWSDRFNVGAAANDGPTDGLARADAKTPAAAATPTTQAAQIYYFHTQPNGLPEELSDNNGHLVWTAQYSTWGSTVREEWQSYDETGRPVQRPLQQSASQTVQLQQNLRMQGQYLDRETGLHYNTFRYYDADLGTFTTPDPIGLAGGLNLHQYASSPLSWIDPWGWACGPTWTKKGWKHVRERHILTTKPRWSHKSKFELGKEGNVKKAIEKTVRHGNATPQKNGRTKYELDHKQKVGSKKDPQTGVSKDQTKITVVTDRHGNVVTSFPSD